MVSVIILEYFSNTKTWATTQVSNGGGGGKKLLNKILSKKVGWAWPPLSEALKYIQTDEVSWRDLSATFILAKSYKV